MLSPGSSLSEVLIAGEQAPGDWRVGIGFGTVDFVSERERKLTGPAAVYSLRAAARTDRTLAGVAVEGEGAWLREVEASANVLMHLLSGRSERQRLVVALRRGGCSAEEAAEQLGITRRAVHKHLSAAGYSFEIEARRVLDRLAAHAAGSSALPEPAAQSAG